jgi:serpin B
MHAFTRTQAEEARKEINNWVSRATKGLITDVLPHGSVDAKTGLMLVNAIYFKGKWVTPFTKRCTEVEDFYLLDGTAVETPLMRGCGSYLVAVHGGFKVLKLPYQAPPAFSPFGGGMQMAKVAHRGGVGAMYSLCVFLPDARDGLWSLVDELAASGPAFLHDHLPWREVCVGKLRLPRFKMSFSSDLTNALRVMGLEATLDPRDEGATDLTDMAERRGYDGVSPKIDKVCHKAVIELNEEGTEAAAVTYVVMSPTCAPSGYRPETVDFVADHPFAFFVMEEVSGAVVFAGCVLDPSQ